MNFGTDLTNQIPTQLTGWPDTVTIRTSTRILAIPNRLFFMAKISVLLRIERCGRQVPQRRASIPLNRYQSIPLDDLWRRLYLYAVVLTGGANVVMRCGLSAEDLAAETFNKYLLSPNGLGWRQSKGSLTTFLGTVLRNRFIDHLRHQKKEASRTDDDSDEIPVRSTIPRTHDDDIAAGELAERILDLVKGHKNEKELQDFVHASTKISETGKVNQQLAEQLKIDEEEVVNRRKMLLRVIGVKELYKEFRHGRKREQSAS